jgi:sulfur carrier protein ThiS
MRKSGITVRIGRFGHEPETVELEADCTVEDALEAAEISFSSAEKVVVNGERATARDILEDGDIVNVYSPKEAGL